MRCDSCNYCYYDYSENYDYCWLGIDAYDNGRSCGCRYNQKTLDKWAEHQEKEEQEEYARMGKFFSEMDKEEQKEYFDGQN